MGVECVTGFIWLGEGYSVNKITNLDTRQKE
jgi:hypothetical protein